MDQPKNIKVQIRNVYGRQRIYPVCSNAKIFTDLIKRKTFLPEDLGVIHKLGYEIEYIPQSIILT